MRELDLVHPEYGLASHKGYATPEHRRALKLYGPCVLHRKTFAPVADADLDLLGERLTPLDLLFEEEDLEGEVTRDVESILEEREWA